MWKGRHLKITKIRDGLTAIHLSLHMHVPFILSVVSATVGQRQSSRLKYLA